MHDEMVAYFVSECQILAQKVYKNKKHDVAKVIHWILCEKQGFQRAEKWYIYELDKILKPEDSTILWYFPIQSDKEMAYNNRPDITMTDKKNKTCQLVDPSCTFDFHIEEKEEWKCPNYQNLKFEIKQIRKMEKVEIIPVAIGVLGRNANKNHVHFGGPGYYGKLAKITGRDLLFCQIGTRIYNQLWKERLKSISK